MKKIDKNLELLKLNLETGIDVWVDGYWWLTGMLAKKFARK